MNDNTNQNKPASGGSKITVLQLTLMTTATVLSLRGIPLMAQEELTMFVYLIIAAAFFLTPATLISAELGTAFAAKGGGVYTWVKEAFNKKIGFIAVFMQWTQNIVWYPITLSFGAAAIAYIVDKPELATNGKFIGFFSLIIYYLSTFASLKGNSFVSKISSSGFLLGTITPLVVLIVMAIFWIVDGNPIAFDSIPAAEKDIAITIDNVTKPRFIPDLTGLGNIVFLSTIILLFSGIEALSVHATRLENPKTQYPKAILIAAVLCFVFLSLGSLAISAILPYSDITLQAGIMESFKLAFNHYNLSWVVNILAILVVIGCTSSVISWITGPSTALLYTAKDGELPKFLTVVNKNGIQKNILFVQGILVTALCSLYFILEDVSVAFFLLSALNGSLYLVMYMLMYISAIKLRKSQPDLERPFVVPGGKYGIYIFGGGGLITVIFAFILCFIPPSQLPISNPLVYTIFLIMGTALFIVIPILISKYMNRKSNTSV